MNALSPGCISTILASTPKTDLAIFWKPANRAGSVRNDNGFASISVAEACTCHLFYHVNIIYSTFCYNMLYTILHMPQFDPKMTPWQWDADMFWEELVKQQLVNSFCLRYIASRSWASYLSCICHFVWELNLVHLESVRISCMVSMRYYSKLYESHALLVLWQTWFKCLGLSKDFYYLITLCFMSNNFISTK